VKRNITHEIGCGGGSGSGEDGLVAMIVAALSNGG